MIPLQCGRTHALKITFAVAAVEVDMLGERQAFTTWAVEQSLQITYWGGGITANHTSEAVRGRRIARRNALHEQGRGHELTFLRRWYGRRNIFHDQEPGTNKTDIAFVER